MVLHHVPLFVILVPHDKNAHETTRERGGKHVVTHQYEVGELCIEQLILIFARKLGHSHTHTGVYLLFSSC